MRTSLILVVVFVLCLLSYLGFLALSAAWLPDRVASHFNWEGKPDGWMGHDSYLVLTAALGLGIPLLLSAVSFIMRYIPDRLMNLPHREYWLAQERRADTYAYMFRHFLWMAIITSCFFAFVHALVLQANIQRPN